MATSTTTTSTGPQNYENLMMLETPDKIYIHSTTPQSSKYLVINRVTDQISVATNPSTIPTTTDSLRSIPISAVIGVINLIAGPYLIIITNSIKVGSINGHCIFRLDKYEIVPFKRNLIHLNEKQLHFNQKYLDMLDTVLSTPHFYYSTTYDLSHNLQSLNSNAPDYFNQPLMSRSLNSNFTWNKYLSSIFTSTKNTDLQLFVVPIVHGFVSINETKLNDKKFSFIIISRRSSSRPGTRLFSRGIDNLGNVSNFVETEQILICDNEIGSFVQIRGSIPLFWEQKHNLKYKPRPVLAQANHSEAISLHFDELVEKYFRVVCVDLVNQSGSESILERSFKHHIESLSLPNVRYEAFDFHHECRNMQWGRLDILLNRLMNEVDEFGFFFHSKRQAHLVQEGVFRTNCIDCLDRTNVVQGMLGREVGERVLKKLGILPPPSKLSDYPQLEQLFKTVWADNGDIVSIEYSGTGALKTDFTRTGKRTALGVLMDGYNSGVRYFKNNFNDGWRKDAMDLFLGNYKVKETEGLTTRCPLDRVRDWKYYVLPFFLLFSALLVFYLAIVPQDYTTENLIYMLVWGSLFLATGGVIMYHGTEYVDNPVLVSDLVGLN